MQYISSFKFIPKISSLYLLTSLTHLRSVTLPCTKESRNYAFQILSNHPNYEISLFLQKGFAGITNPITGKAVHAFIIKHSVHLSIFHSNTLINMYVRFGNLDVAHQVFNRMPDVSDASWNTIISGYVRAGMFLESIELFRKMRGEGVRPNGYVLASLIMGCNRLAMTAWQGIEIHALVCKIGLLADVFVSSAILHVYGTYGFMSDARLFFNEMPKKNIVSWTSLMVGYSKNDEPGEAANVYQLMRQEGVSCNANSLATMISSCWLLDDEWLGLQVLAHVVIYGLGTDISVENALITMFGSFGRVGDACYVFDRMEERDTISWNSMISAYLHNGNCEESLWCFHQMRCANVKPDSTTLSSLVSSCSCMDDPKWGMGIHGLLLKVGNDSIVTISNTLITMYSLTSKSEDAELVFHLMHERDLISWNSMVACFGQSGRCRDALKLLVKLLGTREKRNHLTFANALSACSSPESLLGGKLIHALTILVGLQANMRVGNALVTMYGKCGAMVEAKRVFEMMPEKDLVTWNAMIGGHADIEERHEAMKAFKLMRKLGLPTNYITIVNVLGACSSSDGLLKYGMPVHAHAISSGFDLDDYVKNSLLTMYANCGELGSSNFIFNKLTTKSVISWNAIIAAHAHHGQSEEAMKLVVGMRRVGLELDQFSLSVGLAATANLAVLEEGQQLHNLMIKLGFNSDLHVLNAAMDMYGKCGKMDDALRILFETSKRSRLSWNILISGYARHGCFEKARESFQEMLDIGLKPDHVTFVSLLSACNHAGLVEEGLMYFNLMTSNFGIQPGMEHCACIVDLLGRSGRLVDAERFIREMPISPTNLVWRSLLAACRTHGNLEMGKRAAEHLLELDPSDDSAYVLLSNVCAINKRWDDVEKVRNQMQSYNIRKRPACSWIKVKNKVNSFGIGDRTHPQANKIYAKLEELLQMIKKVGYVADTTFVLHDTDDEQKEHNLWNHSEKLALAFGLISTPEASTIRIFKNLRVCGDCHSVYKFVSWVVGREIVLRDPYRFHHFSGGTCSCSDYW